MKICVIGDAGSVHIPRWAKWFSKKHEVHVITERNNKIDGVKVHYIPYKYIFPQFITNAFKVRKLVRKIKPDIVHANGWKYTVSEVCRMLGVPCVITAHHGGIVCPNGMLMDQFDTICDVSVSFENCLNCSLHFVPGGDFFSPIISKLPKNYFYENLTDFKKCFEIICRRKT